MTWTKLTIRHWVAPWWGKPLESFKQARNIIYYLFSKTGGGQEYKLCNLGSPCTTRTREICSLINWFSKCTSLAPSVQAQHWAHNQGPPSKLESVESYKEEGTSGLETRTISMVKERWGRMTFQEWAETRSKEVKHCRGSSHGPSEPVACLPSEP